MAKTQQGRIENPVEPETEPSAYAHKDVIKRDFALRLRQLLSKKGWTQTDLANAAKKHMPDKSFGRYLISGYVNAQYLPHPLNLEAIAAALGVATEELIPNRGNNLPRRGEATPPSDLRELGDGRASLRINKVVTMGVALEVMRLISDSEKQR